MNIYDSKEYKRSRIAYIFESTFEYFISLLVGDAFLAKLLSSTGMSDSLVGILSSVTALVFMFQVFSVFLVRLKFSTKYTIMVMDFLSVTLYALMYLTPFIKIPQSQKATILAVFVLLATLIKHTIISMIFKFGNSCVDPAKRASFSATKEMFSLVTGMVFTAIVGYVFDKFEFGGNINGGFMFIFVLIAVLNVSNLVSIGLMKKETNIERQGDSEPFGVVIKNTLGNKKFRHVIIGTSLYKMAVYFTIGFMGIYKTKQLMYSAFAIQVINIVSNIVRMLISKPFGKYSDNKSYTLGLRLGMLICAAAFFINIFTTGATRYLVIVFTILYSCSLAGTNQNGYNITYSYVDTKYITQAIAIKNCIGGLFSFGASLLGGKILSVVQQNGNMVFGINIQGQQLLSFISCVTILLGVCYINKHLIKKEEQ